MLAVSPQSGGKLAFLLGNHQVSVTLGAIHFLQRRTLQGYAWAGRSCPAASAGTCGQMGFGHSSPFMWTYPQIPKDRPLCSASASSHQACNIPAKPLVSVTLGERVITLLSITGKGEGGAPLP